MSRQLLGWNSHAPECLSASKIHYVWSAYMFSTLSKKNKKRDKACAINCTYIYMKKGDHSQTIQTTSAENQCLLFLLCTSFLCLVIYSAFPWINSQSYRRYLTKWACLHSVFYFIYGAQPRNNTLNVERVKKIKKRLNLVVHCVNLKCCRDRIQSISDIFKVNIQGQYPLVWWPRRVHQHMPN